MKRPFMLILTFALLLVGGCAGQKYVEQPTPPGQVAPPLASVQADPYRPAAPPLASAQPYRPAESGPAVAFSGDESATSTNVVPLMSESVVETFAGAYRQAGRPRMAVLLNRALSDEVREWRTAERGVVSVNGTITRETEKGTSTFQGPGGVSAYGQRHIEDSGRQVPADEGWMWAFEDGFLGAFLDAGAQMVDRATIMRLAAADSSHQGSAYDPVAVKKIEMDALRGKADLFIEILIRRASGSKLGYDFKASAKEVETGIIRANVSTRGWDYCPRKPKEKVIATETGYQFVDESESGELPDVGLVSRDVALSLMQSLARSWSR